jgi:integrase
MWMKPLIEFALETGMRRGEMLALTWANVDLTNRTAYLPLTKNGESRTVPLSSKAIQILKSLPRNITGQVFPIKPEAVAAAFIKATRRAGVKDFHFHDLRHTAITHLATKLPNLIELAAVSGHKSLAMLKRYYHPTAKDLALKLG